PPAAGERRALLVAVVADLRLVHLEPQLAWVAAARVARRREELAPFEVVIARGEASAGEAATRADAADARRLVGTAEGVGVRQVGEPPLEEVRAPRRVVDEAHRVVARVEEQGDALLRRDPPEEPEVRLLPLH